MHKEKKRRSGKNSITHCNTTFVVIRQAFFFVFAGRRERKRFFFATTAYIESAPRIIRSIETRLIFTLLVVIGRTTQDRFSRVSFFISLLKMKKKLSNTCNYSYTERIFIVITTVHRQYVR